MMAVELGGVNIGELSLTSAMSMLTVTVVDMAGEPLSNACRDKVYLDTWMQRRMRLYWMLTYTELFYRKCAHKPDNENRFCLWDIILEMHPYKFSVKSLIDFEQSCNRVEPELVVPVAFQDGVGDSPVNLAVKILCKYLNKGTKQKLLKSCRYIT